MDAMTGRDLRALFEPRSVAVVGASNDPAKWGPVARRSCGRDI
jgi:acyl-CoA synthetase (NDP forming)